MPIIGLTEIDLAALDTASAGDLYAALVANIAARVARQTEQDARADEHERALAADVAALLTEAGAAPGDYSRAWAFSPDGRAMAVTLEPRGFVWRVGFDWLGIAHAGREAPLLVASLSAAGDAAYRFYPQCKPPAYGEGAVFFRPKPQPDLYRDRAEALARLAADLSNPDHFWSEDQVRALRQAGTRVVQYTINWRRYGVEPEAPEEE